MDDNTQVLISTAIQLPEVEEDDDRDLVETAQIRNDFLDLISSIGHPEFKYIFHSILQSIILQSNENQTDLCRELLNKVKEVYNFEFLKSIDFIDSDKVSSMYKFVSFLEFDNLEFFCSFWKKFKVDILRFDSKLFLSEKNFENELELSIKESISDELISEFLRTNNKENLINFISDKTEKSKFWIAIKIAEGEFENGEIAN